MPGDTNENIKVLAPGDFAMPGRKWILKSHAALMFCLLAALLFCLLAASTASAKHTQKPLPPTPKAAATFDETRDPAKDLQDTIAVATKQNKRILMEVGGDWCVYCNIMDETFSSHPQLRKLRDTNFVTLKVNYSKENGNEAFLSKYPKIADYPHFFVLDSTGVLLHSQPTHPFEHGKKYNVSKIETFLNRWSRPPPHLLNLKKPTETDAPLNPLN
jgi:thiol:disulfide interchange protein